MRSTLFVAGFRTRTRAIDLAYEFERYGPLVRCDIPAPKTYLSKPYAFVEYQDPRDAQDAFNDMHGRRIENYTISVQWARHTPGASWRSISPGGYDHTKDRFHPDDFRYHSRQSSYPPCSPPMHYRYPRYRRPDSPPRQRYYSRSPDSPPRQRYYSRSPDSTPRQRYCSPPRQDLSSSITSSPSQSKYDRAPPSPAYHRPYSPHALRSPSPPPLEY